MASLERSGRKVAAGAWCSRGHHPAASYIRLGAIQERAPFFGTMGGMVPYVEWIAARDVELPSETTDNLLDSIEDSQLFHALQSADKHTLQIILLKLEGYSSREIARLLGMDEYAVNMRIYRLRKKLKKYF